MSPNRISEVTIHKHGAGSGSDRVQLAFDSRIRPSCGSLYSNLNPVATAHTRRLVVANSSLTEPYSTDGLCLPLTAYCLLFFPEHDVLEKRMMRRETRDAEPGKPVTKTALENITANKRGRRGCGDFQG